MVGGIFQSSIGTSRRDSGTGASNIGFANIASLTGQSLPRHSLPQSARGPGKLTAAWQGEASRALAQTLLQPAVPLHTVRDSAPLRLSCRGPLRQRLGGQGIPVMLSSPRRSVLVDHDPGPTNSRFGSEVPGSGRRLQQRRRPSLGLEAKTLAEVQTILLAQLEVAWMAVASILFAGEAGIRPSTSQTESGRSKASGSGRPLAHSQASGQGSAASTPPVSTPPGSRGQPSPGGGASLPSSAQSALTPSPTSPRADGGYPHTNTPASDVGRLAASGNNKTAGAAQQGASPRWVVPMPEAGLDLATCGQEMTGRMQQLRREAEELSSQMQSGEEERVRLEKAITSAHSRLELLHSSLEGLQQERGSCDELLKAMEAENASLAGAAGSLLDSLHGERRRLGAVALR